MSNVAIAALGLIVLTAPTVFAQTVVNTVVNVVPASNFQQVRPGTTVVNVVPVNALSSPPGQTVIRSIPANTTPNAANVTVVNVAPGTASQPVSSGAAIVNIVPASTTIQAQATTGGICPADLTNTLNRIVTRTPGVRWGVLVQTQGAIGSRFNVYAWNPRVQLAPASNNKIFTTAAVLQKLGPQFRLRTIVTGNSTAPNLAVMRITGQGDPSLTTAHMGVLARRLQQRGIRQVNLLIGDDTYFRGAALNPNWDPDDTLTGYGAPVNSLMINQNAIGVTLFPQRVGQSLRVQWDDPSDAQDYRLNNQAVTVAASQGESIDVYRDRNSRTVNIEGQLRAGSASEQDAAAINNPGNYMVQKFRNALAAAGITVTQSTLVRSSAAPPGEPELASVESSPLATLLNETNQESNNMYAEALLKTVGKAQNPNNTDATAAGIAAVKAILSPLGVDASQYNMVDGSGLASNNRATAEAFVQTLQAVGVSPNASVYRSSLPVAGVSGTLQSRFRNTAAQGRVQAKTGTISGVVSLSGYAAPPNYSPLVFSVVTNSSVSAATVRSAVDELVVTLMRLRRC